NPPRVARVEQAAGGAAGVRGAEERLDGVEVGVGGPVVHVIVRVFIEGVLLDKGQQVVEHGAEGSVIPIVLGRHHAVVGVAAIVVGGGEPVRVGLGRGAAGARVLPLLGGNQQVDEDGNNRDGQQECNQGEGASSPEKRGVDARDEVDVGEESCGLMVGVK